MFVLSNVLALPVVQKDGFPIKTSRFLEIGRPTFHSFRGLDELFTYAVKMLASLFHKANSKLQIRKHFYL